MIRHRPTRTICDRPARDPRARRGASGRRRAARRRRRAVWAQTYSLVSLPALLSAYCASKFALEGFSEALSYELAPLGIRVKVVEPGGVTSTRFVARSASEASQRAPIDDYAPFVAGAARVFDELKQARSSATSEDVARVVLDAATDGTDRLRYLATKDIAPLVRARRQTSEEAYMDMMRSRFAPRL
ncbi:SDR family NAD(P)-dependent oxidoreductase [Sorangium sp. So ce1128]